MRGALIIALFILAATLGRVLWDAQPRAPPPVTIAEEISKPKHSFKECGSCPEMIVIPAGSFVMGSPDDEKNRANNEGPQHRVTFARPFAVGRFA